jgi:hypothetical protein
MSEQDSSLLVPHKRETAVPSGHEPAQTKKQLRESKEHGTTKTQHLKIAHKNGKRLPFHAHIRTKQNRKENRAIRLSV